MQVADLIVKASPIDDKLNAKQVDLKFNGPEKGNCSESFAQVFILKRDGGMRERSAPSVL